MARWRASQPATTWIVGAAASAEAIFASVQGAIDRRADHFVLWLVAALAIYLLVMTSEKYKGLRRR